MKYFLLLFKLEIGKLFRDSRLFGSDLLVFEAEFNLWTCNKYGYTEILSSDLDHLLLASIDSTKMLL